MSNDTDFSLRLRHKSKKYLEQVRHYAEEKKSRCDEVAGSDKDIKALMKKVGAKNRNEVISWGFDFDKIVRKGGRYCLPATIWANQNSLNMHVTGGEGELADILSKFTELEIEGEFKDECGWGTISKTNQEYEGCGEQYEEGDLDSGLLSCYRYYPDSEVLKLEFSSGKIYRYDSISRQDVVELMKAKSMGKYFNSCIRDCCDGECGWDD